MNGKTKRQSDQVASMARPVEIGPKKISAQQLSDFAFVEADPVADLIDQAVRCEQTFNDNALKTFQLWQAQKIAHARERNQRGLGRICEDCDDLIPKERLIAMPNTTRCIQCQIKIDRKTIYSG